MHVLPQERCIFPQYLYRKVAHRDSEETQVLCVIVKMERQILCVIVTMWRQIFMCHCDNGETGFMCHCDSCETQVICVIVTSSYPV